MLAEFLDTCSSSYFIMFFRESVQQKNFRLCRWVALNAGAKGDPNINSLPACETRGLSVVLLQSVYVTHTTPNGWRMFPPLPDGGAHSTDGNELRSGI